MWWKIFQLTLYFVVVFVICRLLEIGTWYDAGILTSVFLDPFSLSVRQLQRLLEVRGISYAGAVEKQELGQLVYSSGSVQKSELLEVDASDQESTERSHHFSCGAHFYEEVEDTKDSVWLVQVAAAGDESLESRSLLHDKQWNQVVSKVAPFGVRTGIFDCNLDSKLCARKKWNGSRIILTLPRGHRAKDSVLTYTYLSRTSSKPQVVMNWVRKHMASQVHSLNSITEFHEEWMNTSKCDKDCRPNVRIVFISQLPEPPLFFSSLSYKFSGRVSFGSWQVTKKDISSPEFQKLSQGKQLPLYLVITPENLLYYGATPGQFLNFESLALYVQFLRPETNDVFLFSVILLNLLMLFDLFNVGPRFGRHVVMFCWNIVKNNALFLTLWLCVLGLFQFPFIEEVQEVSLKVLRFITSSQFGGVIINDWKFMRTQTILLVSIIVFYSLVMAFIKKKFHFDEVSEVEVPSLSGVHRFLRSVDHFVVGFFFCPISNLNREQFPVDPDFEEGVELLLERLAMPNLWLQPVINTDYVKDLPVWQYRGSEDGSDTDDLSDGTSQSSSEDENNGGSERSEMEACNTCLIQQQKNQNSTAGPSWSTSECRRRPPSPLLIKATKKAEKCQSNRLRELFTRFRKAICSSKVPCSNISGDDNNRVEVINNDQSCNDPGTSNQDSPKHRCGHDLTDDEKKNEEQKSWAPAGMLECGDCAICLERYRYDVTLCGLPCGHNYHQQCIMLWLARDNHQCPVCRWPTYKLKHKKFPAS